MLALKPLLTQSHISQAQLARLVDLSPATIAQLLNKNLWPTVPSKKILTESITTALATQGITVTAEHFLPLHETTTQPNEVNTMLLQKQTLSKETKAYFKLKKSPFDDDLNSVEDVFLSDSARTVKAALWSVATVGGFVVITGESGSGKTTLLLELEDRIASGKEKIILIRPSVLRMEDNDVKGKTLKTGDIEDAIIYSLNPDASPKRTAEAKYRQLEKMLKDSHNAGYTHVLMLDESHCLSKPTARHFKRLREIRIGFRPLLGIVLIGHPELSNLIFNQSGLLKEVSQRIEEIELKPLGNDLKGYLTLKFQQAHSSFEAVCEPDVIDAILANQRYPNEQDMTYPLAVNNLMNMAMNKVAQLGISDKVSKETIDLLFPNKQRGIKK